MTAEIIAFPVDRETTLVRDTARQLSRRHGALADKFWKTELRRLYGRMQVQGLQDATIRAEINRFAAAVMRELERRTAAIRLDHGGDAA